MTQLKLTKGRLYSYAGVRYARNKPEKVLDPAIVDYLLRTGRFEVVGETKVEKPQSKVVIKPSNKVVVKKKEADTLDINPEDYGVPVRFSKKAELISFAKEKFDVELNEANTTKVLYAELLVAAKQHAEKNTEEDQENIDEDAVVV